ncbi:MAG: HPr family phosphocarrier protein [Pseudomonadota bacterium]
MVADLEIVNDKGLHARASAQFAAVAERYQSKICVSKDALTVNGASLMGLLMLVASKGSVIRVSATGADAGAAIEALRSLVASRFGEAA